MLYQYTAFIQQLTDRDMLSLSKQKLEKVIL